MRLEGGMGTSRTQECALKAEWGMKAKALHSLLFMRRRDLLGGHRPEHPRGRVIFADHPDDVVLVVKRYAWMATMSQRPLVISPHDLGGPRGGTDRYECKTSTSSEAPC